MAQDPKVTFQIDAELRNINAKLTQLEGEFKDLQTSGAKSGEGIGSSFASLQTKVLGVAAALASVYTVIKTIGATVEKAGEFEALETRLVNLYQSAEKGAQVFGEFKKLAATTPFNLQDVVEGGAMLKAFGLDAEATLKSVTDLAAFMGTDVVTAAQAVGRAFAGGVGAADVLRERGILNLVKSFKGIDDLTKLTLPEFRKALITTMQDPVSGIAGATDRLSQTFVGVVSNMRDAIDQLSAHIGFKFLPIAKDVAGFVGRMVNDLLPKESEQLRDQQLEFQALTEILQDTNTEEGVRADIITRLQEQYGSYLGNVDLEKASYDELGTLLKTVNAEFEKRIMLAASEEILAEKARKMTEARKILLETTIRLRKEEENARRASESPGWLEDLLRRGNVAILRNSINELAVGYENAKNEYSEFKTELLDMGILDDVVARNAQTTQQTENQAKAVNRLMDAYRELNAVFEVSGEQRAKTLQGVQEIKAAEGDLLAQIPIEETIDNLQNAQRLLENFASQLAFAATNGRNMGEAVVNALKQIIAQLLSLSAVYGLMQLIPGGGAFTGGLSGFIGKAFGFGTASVPNSGFTPAGVNVVVEGALPGQEFVTKSITPSQGLINRRRF